MSKDTGGPAFPDRLKLAADSGFYVYGGMTLRDYFATQAMLGEIVTSASDATPKAAQALVDAAVMAGRSPAEQIAANAYEIADAMLAERAKSGAA